MFADMPNCGCSWPPELLQLYERFLTTAGPGVIAERHAFLTAEGAHPATAVGWFTDSLSLATHHPEPGEWLCC